MFNVNISQLFSDTPKFSMSDTPLAVVGSTSHVQTRELRRIRQHKDAWSSAVAGKILHMQGMFHGHVAVTLW